MWNFMHEEKNKDNVSKHRIYVDTNILQAANVRKSTPDIVFLENAKKQNWEIFTSIHTFMELLDTEKDREFLMKCIIDKGLDVSTFLAKRKSKKLSKEDLSDLAAKVNNFFFTNRFIQVINIKDPDWNLVKKIGETSNLHSSDILHLVTAWAGNCQLLVTNDEDFIMEGNKVLQQENVYDHLRVCGIKDVEATLKEIKLPRTLSVKVQVSD
jgi:predicted nucleic acid-binding protein